MSLVEHLTELRQRLVKTAYILAIGFAAAWYFKEFLFDVVRAPIEPFLPTSGLIFTNPIDKFMAYLKMTFVASVILTCPGWLYQVWRFIAPGLHQHERKFSIAFIFFGTILFLIGVSFAYFLVFPMAFDFLFSFGSSKEKPMITITEYFSFFTTITLVFGAAFELPLILSLLGFMGIISSKFLRDNRRYAIVVMAIFSAVVTPPDALSMMMLLVPLSILYEISILVVRMVERKRAAV